MESLIERLKIFNEKWNDLPRRALIVIVTCLGLILAWKAFRYLAPFIVALVFSWIVKPIAKPIEKLLGKLHLPKKVGALISVIFVFGVLFSLLIYLAVALAGEAKSLLGDLPGYIQGLTDYITELASQASELMQDNIGEEALNTIYELLMSTIKKLTELVSGFAGWLVSFTLSAVMSLPDVMLFVLFMIMECYYIVADRHEIGAFFRKLMPEKVADSGVEIKDVMVSGIRAQFITAILQMLIAAVILCVGFRLMRLEYALTLGVVISVLDALPVIGAGLIMFPMILFYLITGEYMLSVATIALYLIMQIVKRITEPKMLGAQMRLNQLATMVAMFAGYKIMGYLGLLTGPLMLKLFIAILNSSEKAHAAGLPAAAQPVPTPPAAPKKGIVGKRNRRKK